jgi:hypothetical protein
MGMIVEYDEPSLEQLSAIERYVIANKGSLPDDA